ncbi:glutamine amidotransferase [bacterium SM23_31]|nr:MAG: glutamine amidotransferase [bacterium SM23_31]
MCGIIGYIGNKDAAAVLMQGLKRMEYRGYDSAGVALIDNNNGIFLHKQPGKIAELKNSLKYNTVSSNAGVGHTRWATHGEPSEKNAHPFVGCKGTFAIAHNGIIENYKALRKNLKKKGCVFSSNTDSEVIVHLIESYYDGDFGKAVRRALSELWGAYGIVVVSSLHPDTLIAARNGSPMIAGLGKDENFVASDVAAFIRYTRDIMPLQDNEMAIISRDEVQTKTLEDTVVSRPIETVDIDLKKIEKGGFNHFMLKEINEQPNTIRDSFRGRILLGEGLPKLGGLQHIAKRLIKARRLILTACGTSWHAALVGEYLIEELALVPVEVEYASEFRYRKPILDNRDVVIAISQSGETADTLAAIKETKKQGAMALGICNVVGSSIARETDGGIYIHAGPEIGVASTKAFTSQVVVLSLIAVFLGSEYCLTKSEAKKILKALTELPDKVKNILDKASFVKKIAEEFNTCQNFLYLGRGYNFPVALEGALKLKEISYIHAEGYPAAEMKHGPIALIDESMPVVFIAPKNDITYPKILSNIEEVKARKGKVIVVATEGDEQMREIADSVIYIPETLHCLTPILAVIPLQLLAYYIAVQRGCDVDQPRNLAKSVTVE